MEQRFHNMSMEMRGIKLPDKCSVADAVGNFSNTTSKTHNIKANPVNPFISISSPTPPPEKIVPNF